MELLDSHLDAPTEQENIHPLNRKSLQCLKTKSLDGPKSYQGMQLETNQNR